MGVTEVIRQTIACQTQGTVFSSADFLHAGTRSAVDQALVRMVQAGTIERVARGLYAAAGQRADAAVIARAVAQKTGEQVGMALVVEAHDVQFVPTSGTSRTLRAVGQVVHFRRMGPRKVQLATTPKGRVLLGLWLKGQKRLTKLDIVHAIGEWTEGEVDAYAALMPTWLRVAIAQATAKRKSVQIGLSGAYDWSNPSIKDEVLIGKVLEKHRYEDLTRLCLYYGVPKVKRVYKRRSFDPMTSASLARMLGNISKGLRAKQEPVHG